MLVTIVAAVTRHLMGAIREEGCTLANSFRAVSSGQKVLAPEGEVRLS